MADRPCIILRTRQDRGRAVRWIEQAPDGTVVEFKQKGRSSDQNLGRILDRSLGRNRGRSRNRALGGRIRSLGQSLIRNLGRRLDRSPSRSFCPIRNLEWKTASH